MPTNAYAILAIVFACFVLPPVGIYLGGKAKQQIAESGERGIELANLAVVLGWIFTVLQVVIVLLVCDIFGTVILTAASRGSSF
ncbi:DUF4190 domain-containing protein [Hamadaea tsunoensis]|uniref:DUF4190 domain-containing protein n=1 Tax=Hamadaea tsunoensis TaxID=53368 RepID=UPI000684C2BD|nr:DUF4190 domain-containing protein [Hamadaea tsunoensis]